MYWKTLHLQALPMRNKTKKAAVLCVRAVVLLSLAGLLPSCSQQGDERQEQVSADTGSQAAAPAPTAEERLYQEVMDLHDEAMEQMSLIRRLSRQLSDSIENTGVNPMEQEETIDRYRNRLQKLKEADEAMRQWMRRFNYQNVQESEKMAYLQQEKERIEEVDRKIDDAIAAARESLQQ